MIQHWTGFVTRKCFSVASHTQLRLIYFRNGSVLRQVFSWLLRGILASSFKSCGQLSDVRCEVGVVCFVGICLVCGAVRCCTSPAELFLATPSCVVTKPALYCAQWGFPPPAAQGGTWYREPMVAEVGGITLFTKKKRASSGLRLILLRMRK